MTGRLQATLPADGFNDIAMCRDGPMLYNRHDQYIGASLRQYGEYCQGEIDLFAKVLSPGATVVEAGANIGVHTVALSKLTGPQGAVVAFEPQRLVLQTLCANLALNSCANVHALQAGLGAMAGQMRVPPFPPDRPLNFGGVSLMGGETGEAVAIKTLDDMDLPACALIKLDIEGMEVDALYGAARTIKTLRPLLYVENDRAARSDQLISLLLDWDYRLFAHVTPLFSVANHAGCQDDIFGAVASFNMFCVPRERNLTVTDGVEITTPRMWIWPQV